MSFRLRDLSRQDVIPCAHIAAEAFASDRHTQLKAAMLGDPYREDYVDSMYDALRNWFDGDGSDLVELTVAEDVEERKVIGWVAWGFNAQPPDGQAGSEGGDGDGEDEGEDEGGDEGEGSAHPSARERLERHTDADLRAWMRRLMPPGAPCMYVASIAVAPAHQGKGVGEALVRMGLEEADELGYYCWVHASEAGASLFEKCGFEEVGRLVLNLDEWNEDDARTPEGKAWWGGYCFRYMRRDAKEA